MADRASEPRRGAAAPWGVRSIDRCPRSIDRWDDCMPRLMNLDPHPAWAPRPNFERGNGPPINQASINHRRRAAAVMPPMTHTPTEPINRSTLHTPPRRTGPRLDRSIYRFDRLDRPTGRRPAQVSGGVSIKSGQRGAINRPQPSQAGGIDTAHRRGGRRR